MKQIRLRMKLEKSFMESAFVEAAAEGHLDAVLEALERGVDVNVQNGFGDTALMEAAKNGHVPVVKLLLERGADVDAKNHLGRSALMGAASLGHTDVVTVLLDAGASVNATDKHDDTALTQASGQIDATRVLLERGAWVNWRNSSGTSALMRAAKYGHSQVLGLLIAHGSDVDAQNVNGTTALMRATSHGHATIVQQLLLSGAEVDLRNRDGATALMRAAVKRQLEILLILLSAGADLYARDKDGSTALSIAAMFGHTGVLKALIERQSSDPVRELMEVQTDGYGDSPLILAARSGHSDAVRLLLDGLEKDHTDTEKVDLLRKQLNCRNKIGNTALIEAARQGHYEVTQILLEKGADFQAKNFKGQTALMVAPLKGDCKLFNLLIEKGGDSVNHESKQKTELLPTVIEPPAIAEDESDFEDTLGEWLTRSRVMRATFLSARDASESDSAILLLGESGSGKDFLSQYIHNHSKRANGPFRSVNCAALPRGLAESELFGHEKGAFTGATGKKRGVFELAHGGTVFLNEIGDMPLELQAKLLTFLDSHRFQRVGGEKEIESDARIVAATNRDLNKDVAAGRFRLDLYHRLAVWPIRIPSLRERLEDIPLLAEVILADLCARSDADVPKVSQAALNKLSSHKWEGNVRELKNVLERALILCHGTIIDSGHVRLNQAHQTMITAQGTGSGRRKGCTKPSSSQLHGAYEQYIVKQAWSRARLAEHFGVDSSTLKKWLKDAGLPAGSAGRPRKKRAE
jgi:DNA-binding NtrC family response regulator/ankyrin repeat protein